MPKILTKGLLIKSLRPSNLLGIPLGLSLYMINKKGELFINKRSILQFILAVVYNILILYYTSCLDCGNSLKTTGLLKMVSEIRDYSWYFTTTFSMLAEYLYRDKIIAIIKDLQHYDDKKQVCYKDFKKFVFKGFLGVLLLVLVILWSDSLVLKRTNMEAYAICHISYLTVYFIKPVALLKFILINYLLQERFRGINKFLEDNKEVQRKVSG